MSKYVSEVDDENITIDTPSGKSYDIAIVDGTIIIDGWNFEELIKSKK